MVLRIERKTRSQLPRQGCSTFSSIVYLAKQCFWNFNQNECQVSVANEYIVPDSHADPGNVALTTFFDAVCDLGLSTADAVSSLTCPAPREIIQEFLVNSDSFRILVKFAK
jgi:hypothetical protein